MPRTRSDLWTQEPPSLSHELSGYDSRVKARYIIEKWIDESWVAMAKVPDGCDRIEELRRALGGTTRLFDLDSGVAADPEELEIEVNIQEELER